MIRHCHIQNYRGLKDVKLPDLGRVNILVGRNGVGKTSLLEAISLASMGNEPERLVWVCLSRGSRMNFGSVESIFTEKGQQVEIALNLQEGSHRLVIDPPKIETGFFQQSDSSDKSTSGVGRFMEVDLKYSHPKSRLAKPPPKKANKKTSTTTHSTQINVGENGNVGLTKTWACATCVHASYVPCRHVDPNQVRNFISTLTEEGREQEIVEIFRICDDRIRDVRLISGDVRIEFEDKSRLPIAALGDGVNRLALLAQGLLTSGNRVLLVDEIDSGMHHSVMESFWTFLISLMEKRPFQLFCSTHDEEMLSSTMAPFADSKSDWLRKIAFTRGKQGELRVNTSGYEDLEYQLKHNYPTRT